MSGQRMQSGQQMSRPTSRAVPFKTEYFTLVDVDAIIKTTFPKKTIEVDRANMRTELNKIAHGLRFRRDMAGEVSATDCADRLCEIRRGADKLLALLHGLDPDVTNFKTPTSDDTWNKFHIMRQLEFAALPDWEVAPKTVRAVTESVGQLSRMAALAEESYKRTAIKRAPQKKKPGPKEDEALNGAFVELANIYEKSFLRKCRISKSATNGRRGGSFARFVAASLCQCGIAIDDSQAASRWEEIQSRYNAASAK